MGKEKYELKVVCSNCDNEQTVEIPKGVEWHDDGFVKGSHIGYDTTFEPKYCSKCGCNTLKKMNLIKSLQRKKDED